MSNHNPAAELIALGALALGIPAGTLLVDEELAYVLHTQLQTNTETSFETAKEHLYNDIDLDGDSIFCVYSGTTVTLVQRPGESFHPDEDDGVEVEHTWASKAEWADASVHFVRASSLPGADLYHLFPVRQGINGSRGSHEFGIPVSEVRALLLDSDGTLHHPHEGAGGTPTGSLRGKDADGVIVFAPPEEHRGNVARAMFYMSVRYWWEIPPNMEDVLKQWHNDDPVDADERQRNDRIATIQHNRNPFIDDPTLVDQIDDF